METPKLYIVVASAFVYWRDDEADVIMSGPMNANGTPSFDPDEAVCLDDVGTDLEWRAYLDGIDPASRAAHEAAVKFLSR